MESYIDAFLAFKLANSFNCYKVVFCHFNLVRIIQLWSVFIISLSRNQ